MKGEEHIWVNFPIDTSLKKKVHSAMLDTYMPGGHYTLQYNCTKCE